MFDTIVSVSKDSILKSYLDWSSLVLNFATQKMVLFRQVVINCLPVIQDKHKVHQ